MGDGWTTLRIDDVPPIPVVGSLQWHPLRRALGVEAFGVNAYSAARAGDDVVEEHTETRLRHEEVYVVLTGRATFTLDGEPTDAPAGTIVFVRDPSVRRHARAEEPGTRVLAIGGKPGEPYRPSAWEWYFAAEQYRASGDHVSALDLLREGRAVHPDHAGIEYAVACWQALSGDTEAALASLLRAVELDADVAAWAARDEDLASLRTLPGFPIPGAPDASRE